MGKPANVECKQKCRRLSRLVIFKMVNSCAALNCGGRSDKNDNSKFFRLPAVKKHAGKVKQSLFKKRRDLWLSRLKRTDLLQDNHANLRVCSKHFISGKNISILFICKCIIDLDRGKDWTYSFIFNGFVCSHATF